MLFNTNLASSQSFPKFEDIKLAKAADYKAADSFALLASVFLLSAPVDKNIERVSASVFLFKWMAGTPDFSFSTDAELLKGNDDLIEIYLACVAKYCLENKPFANDNKQVKLNVVKLLLQYCELPGNNVKMSTYLKKLSEANQKGVLEKEL